MPLQLQDDDGERPTPPVRANLKEEGEEQHRRRRGQLLPVLLRLIDADEHHRNDLLPGPGAGLAGRDRRLVGTNDIHRLPLRQGLRGELLQQGEGVRAVRAVEHLLQPGRVLREQAFEVAAGAGGAGLQHATL